MFKVLSQQLQGLLAKAFKRYFKVEDFKEMDHHQCKLIMDKHRWKKYDRQSYFLINHHDTGIDEDAYKIISWIKI